MSPLITAFRDCAHQAGEVCNLGNGILVREFGLRDFIENKLAEDDDAPAIALKALEFFCDEREPHNRRFRFGVLAVGIFLDENYARTPRDSMHELQQALKDLVSILTHAGNEFQLRGWIDSHFGS
jgi:hypothetical protein